jgi:hypothetical protein
MMTCETSRTAHQVVQLGVLAARALGRPSQGQVAAVFDRSLYCLIDGEYVCVGVDSLSMCPLNVITSVPEGSAWSSYGFRIGMPVNVASDHMNIGSSFFLNLKDAPVWKPPPHSDLFYEKVKEGLAALEEAIAGSIPQDGLGGLLAPVVPGVDLSSKYLSHAAEALIPMKDWLKMALRDPLGNRDPDIHAWQDLLGLGPGLTPSGDDLTGGMMLALHRLGQFSILRSLSTAVALVVDDRTNPISAAHLKAAMEGMGSEAVHRAMDSILADDRAGLPAALGRVEKVGHTSGWDTLAGIVIVFRLWLETHEKRCAASSN